MRSLMIFGVALASFAQPPCDEAHKGQFDFWIGEWNVYDTAGTLVGTNSIQPMFEGCVLQENWEGASGSKGSSFNFYNSKDAVWEQFWVWQNGTTLHLQGGLNEGSMVLSGETTGKEGRILVNRITWTPNPDGSVRQHWEVSKDAGATFTSVFDGLYKKKS
ncbi:MAG: hypothetical protein KDC35_09045 [Acidobacteria bacterium]|nr:hypothetical protein [Acidobacteriota bacterium]